ncbi:hypothetical protein BDM02DRAFT_2746303 [Thelephora ganbajun]|uniref:Uncharacterized protein n=1 Tax=Thelephora ganbajun TaxID=370292 RepID=A0ACB6ZDG4_THEGA|nr:hypothetical protein BDM02DRAFT_2746303 [Thelephora ganbajun]
MHHVFELDEILRLIASDLIDTGDGGALSLACCCRSFSTPVLDTMWEEGQSDFTTLLKTFPCSVWRVVNMTFRFTRQPSEEEWAQFSLYARRMRKLFIFPHETVFPSPVGFRLLSAHFSGSCMLPNLRELDWCNTRADTGIALIFPSLVSPFLENLHYELRDISHTRTVLSALTPAYSSLQYIYFTRSDPGLVQEFSTLLLKCNPNQLHFFSAGSPLSRTAFLHASQLPDLQYFDTPAIQADGLEPLGDASLPTAMFSSLQYLYMRGLDTGSIWLRSLTRLCFENLLMLVLELKNAAAARTCLPLTLKYLRYQTLTELVIRFDKAGIIVYLLSRQMRSQTLWRRPRETCQGDAETQRPDPWMQLMFQTSK